MWQMISAIGSVLALIVSSAMFIAIKFNDVKHIQLAVERIEKSVRTMTEDTTQLKITVAESLVRCNERHRVRRTKR